MKEKLIQEISTAMAEVLSFEQVAHLNSVLLQVISQYTITEDGEALHENAVSNDRLLDIFLSAKQVEGCTTPTIKYYGSTIQITPPKTSGPILPCSNVRTSQAV